MDEARAVGRLVDRGWTRLLRLLSVTWFFFRYRLSDAISALHNANAPCDYEPAASSRTTLSIERLPCKDACLPTLPSGIRALPSASGPVVSQLWGLWRCALLGVSMFLWLAVTQRDLQAQASSSTAHTIFKGLRLSFYPHSGLKPLATFRAERGFTDLQRRGFFRIGLLPVLVCEEVIIEVRETEEVTNALAKVHYSLRSQAGGAMIELRQVEFRFPAASAPRLRAGTARLRDNGQCELLSVTYQSATNRFQASSAMLQLSGEHAGRLSWQSSDGPVAINLFTLQRSTNNPATTQKPI